MPNLTPPLIRSVTLSLAILLSVCAATSSPAAAQDSQSSADRMIVAAIPDSPRAPAVTVETNLIARLQIAPSATADSSRPEDPWAVEGWAEYLRLWEEFALAPADETIRKYFALPLNNVAQDSSTSMRMSRGRSAPRWLQWRSGSYHQVETPHFQIFSHADPAQTRQVADDAERVFWAWSQLFFPLWEGRYQVALHLRDCPDNGSVAAHLATKRFRLTPRKKMRIVLLQDASDYARTLGQDVQSIGQSTGFYSDERQTSFFYPSSTDDAVATRRHELVHQFFLEATRSKLLGKSVGSQNEFWLVEGIAGYFESMMLERSRATVGGWDSPRLQFGRFRMLGQRDLIPFEILRLDGRIAAQQQNDLARWYANAIAYTHAFLDGNNTNDRRWVYTTLASLYEIPLDLPETSVPSNAERSLVAFLRLDDQTLKNNPTTRSISELCLAQCELTSDGIAEIRSLKNVRWLDLSRIALTSKDVTKLCPDPTQIEQLSLEVTKIDSAILPWLDLAENLRDVDLSWTFCDDDTIELIKDTRSIETLWLTGTQITDLSIDALAKLPKLRSIDIQRTNVSSAGLARLRKLRPDCKINPLQLRDQ